MGKVILLAGVFLLAVVFAEACELAADNQEQQEQEEFERQDAEVFGIVNRPKKSKVMDAECGPVIAVVERSVP